MNTLLLDLTFWDLVLDSSGNIAVASAPYAVAQDVASAQRTFQGEVWYNSLIGIPYFRDIFGENPPVSLLAAYMVDAALTVPDVVANPAPVFTLQSFQGRTVVGQTTFTDSDGNTQTVNLQ